MKNRRTSPLMILACTTALAGIGLAAAPAATAAPGGNGNGVKIDNTLPRWLNKATPGFSARMATPSTTTVQVYLAPQGGTSAVAAEIASLSDPKSANFHKWLTPAQYRAKFAPTAKSVNDVKKYLTAAGMTVTGVESTHRYITATGDRAALNAAFGVTLSTYSHDGQTVTANDQAVTLPSSIAASVLTVDGLDSTTYSKQRPSAATTDSAGPGATTPPAGFRNARPCEINWGQIPATYQADYTTKLPKFQGTTLNYAPCGYTGPSFRAAYEGSTNLDGSGATVAIVDAYAWEHIASDANTYAVNHGDGAYAKGQFTQANAKTFTNQDACDPSGWSGEETLDVEAVHAMAPGANIRYYGAASCMDNDLLAALNKVVDQNKAQIVTNSWGSTEGDTSGPSIVAYEQVFMQGATQGISFMFSSGDNGDELANTGIKQADYPASDPWVTAVGGTSTGIAYGSIVTQTGWGSENYALSGGKWVAKGYLYGAGGGFSSLFNRPAWQTKVPASSPAGRAVPDIAMNADPNTGMLIGQTQTFPEGVHYDEYRIGGTSLASPLAAGMAALSTQNAGKGLGFLNAALYSAPKGVITDVTPVKDKGVVRVNYNNGVDATGGLSYFVRTFDQDSSLKTATGWDPVTGLGVPSPAMLTWNAKP